MSDNYTEIRWHGRAQQGIVTAAKLLGESALVGGKQVQAFPEFGPERMGAPVRAYNRISNAPIRVHCQVKEPNIVLIVDPTLIGTVDLTGGTGSDAVFMVNTTHTPAEMREALSLEAGFGKVFTLDASEISLETIGRFMPNTAMLGALSKATGIVEFSSVVDNFKTNYAKKYSPKVIDGNVRAMQRGFDEVQGE